MARKVYNYFKKYPQFSNSIGGFDPKLFDINEVDKEDIQDILSRRTDYKIYFDDFSNLMDTTPENIGIIFKLLFKYSRDGDFLYELVHTDPKSPPDILQAIHKEIEDELKGDTLQARETFTNFRWLLKNMKLAMVGYVQEAIKGSFNGASKGTPQTPPQDETTEQTEQNKPRRSKCGGAFIDLPGCSQK